MLEIETDALINSDADTLWNKLTDFSSYPAWNPLIRIEQGEARSGSNLLIRIIIPGTFSLTLRSKVKIVHLNREMRWRSGFLFRGLFDGEQIFRIIPEGDNKVRFQHIEIFRGLLVPLIFRKGDMNIRRGCEEMNIGLKDSVEALVRT